MGNAKTGDKAPILAGLSKEQLLELAAERGITLDQDMEAEGIIALLIEADPSLGEAPTADDDDYLDDDDNSSTDAEIETPPIKDETPPQEDDDGYEIGTIRTVQGVEVVKIGVNEWVTTIREKLEVGSPVVIVSKKRAGQTIFAKSGKPITFDENGKATVSAVDGQYLESIIINGKPEYTVERNG